jgi:hypothetical protein
MQLSGLTQNLVYLKWVKHDNIVPQEISSTEEEKAMGHKTLDGVWGEGGCGSWRAAERMQ